MPSIGPHAVERARPQVLSLTRRHRPNSVLLLLQPGKVDKRTGDPEAGGKTSGQKAVRTSTCVFLVRLLAFDLIYQSADALE